MNSKLYYIKKYHPAAFCYAAVDIDKDSFIGMAFTRKNNSKDFFKAFAMSPIAACNDFQKGNLRIEKDKNSKGESYVFIANKNIKKDEKLACSAEYYLDLFGNKDKYGEYFAESAIQKNKDIRISNNIWNALHEHNIQNMNIINQMISDEYIFNNIEEVDLSNEDIIEEGIADRRDIFQNIDKWNEGRNNILYITGLSGSGKSTLAKRLAKLYNADRISLDDFANNRNTSNLNIIKKFRRSCLDYNDYTARDPSMTSEKVDEIAFKFIKFIHSELSKSNKKYIVEGILLYEINMHNKKLISFLKNKPLIIKMAVPHEAIFRQVKRRLNPNIKQGIDFNYWSLKTHQKLLDDFVNKLIKNKVIQIDESIIEQDTNTIPIYIVLTSTKSLLAKTIQRFTKTEYNHVSLAFEPDLKRMYSFGTGDDRKTGFALESKDNTYLKFYKDVKCQVYTIFIDKYQSLKLRTKLDEFIARKHKLKFNFLGLIGHIINKPVTSNFAMFCSEFVDSMLKLINIDLTGKASGLVQPLDLVKTKNNIVYKIYDGDMKDYDDSHIKNKLSRAYVDYKNKNKIPIKEAKHFPIQFDSDGNLLIKNMKKISYETEYAKSHKLLIIYSKSNNIEGMKYELSKLWFINNLIENKLFDKKAKLEKFNRRDLIKVRARILNDFNKYLKMVSRYDKKFNFTEYYNNTPFSDAVMIIHKDTLTGIGKLIKNIFI